MTANVKKFCDDNGIVTSWPSKRHLQQEMVAYLASKFNFNTLYSEKEVNDILDCNTRLHDRCTFRRELIENLFMKRYSNGTKYWKIHKGLDYRLETSHFTIEACEGNDAGRLKEINRSAGCIAAGCKEEHTDDYIDHCLSEGDLPPQGHLEFYRFRKIGSKETSEIIGFIGFYYGYPEKTTLWITTFYIDPAFHNQGYGREVISRILEVTGNYGIEDAGVGVCSKNEPALSFWLENGFSAVKDIGVGKVTASDANIVALKRHLT